MQAAMRLLMRSLPVEGAGVAVVRGAEAADLVVLLGHRLHGANARQVLLHLIGKRSEPLLHLHARPAHLPRRPAGVVIDEGQGWQQQQGQHGGEVEHVAEAHDGRVDQDHHQDRAHGDEALDQPDVGDGARHHVADRVLREKAIALALQRLEEARPEVEGDRQSRLAHAVPGKGDDDVAAEHGEDDGDDGPDEHVGARGLSGGEGRGEVVDASGEEEGHLRFEHAGDAEGDNAGAEGASGRAR